MLRPKIGILEEKLEFYRKMSFSSKFVFLRNNSIFLMKQTIQRKNGKNICKEKALKTVKNYIKSMLVVQVKNNWNLVFF